MHFLSLYCQMGRRLLAIEAICNGSLYLLQRTIMLKHAIFFYIYSTVNKVILNEKIIELSSSMSTKNFINLYSLARL